MGALIKFPYLGDVMLKIIPSRMLLLRLLLVALIPLSIKMQSVPEQAVSSQLELVYYERLVPGVTTLIAAEAILGPSTEISSDTTKRTVAWFFSGGTQIKAVFNKRGILESKGKSLGSEALSLK